MKVFLSYHHSSQSNYSSVDVFVFKLLDSQSCQFCCSCLQLSTHVKSLFISIKTTACHNLLVHCIIMSLLNHPDLSSAHKYMFLCQPHQFCQVIFKSVHQDHVIAVIKYLTSHHRFCSLLQVSACYCHVNKVCSCLS